MIHLMQHPSYIKLTRDNILSQTTPYNSERVLMGEELGYQIVIYSDHPRSIPATFRISTLTLCETYIVKDVPVNWAHYSDDTKKDYLIDGTGSVPDCLVPIRSGDTIHISDQYLVLWVSAIPTRVGDQSIRFIVETETETESCEFTLRVLDEMIPKQYINYCEYIDPHSIARDYNVPMFCDVYWRRLQEHCQLAAKNGINDILVPLFTPQYDCYPDEEPVQLVDIHLVGKSGYRFEFGLMDSWLIKARKGGIKRFTFPVFLPSYNNMLGARFMAIDQNGKKVPLFENEGFDSNYYTSFLRKLLREIVAHLRDYEEYANISVHFSAAPQFKDEEAYCKHRGHFYDCIKKYRVADYDVEYPFFKLDHVAAPIIHLHDMTPYLKDDMVRKSGCMDITSAKDVINPLIASSALRLRLLGSLFFRYQVINFFHMGFNYSPPLHARTEANLAFDTDYNNRYPSGTLSLTYPSHQGPYPSVRLKQLKYAIQDYLIYKSTFARYSPDKIEGLIDKYLKLNFEEFEVDPARFRTLREKTYDMIENVIMYNKKKEG